MSEFRFSKCRWGQRVKAVVDLINDGFFPIRSPRSACSAPERLARSSGWPSITKRTCRYILSISVNACSSAV